MLSLFSRVNKYESIQRKLSHSTSGSLMYTKNQQLLIPHFTDFFLEYFSASFCYDSSSHQIRGKKKKSSQRRLCM